MGLDQKWNTVAQLLLRMHKLDQTILRFSFFMVLISLDCLGKFDYLRQILFENIGKSLLIFCFTVLPKDLIFSGNKGLDFTIG